jgi:hypothetical protein
MAPKKKNEKKVPVEAEKSLQISDPLSPKQEAKTFMDVALLRAQAIVGLSDLERKKVKQVARMQLELKLIEHANRLNCRLAIKTLFSKERLKDLNIVCAQMSKGELAAVSNYLEVEEALIQELYKKQEAVNAELHEKESGDFLIGEEDGGVF